MGEAPLASTLNCTVLPCTTVLLSGCRVMVGDVPPGMMLTVNVALELVMLPAPLLTTTEKSPASVVSTVFAA